MKGMIVNVLVGVGLFAGALVGGLMATGRWNHDGVANIPVLNSFFPEPPKAEGEEGKEGEGHGESKDAHGNAADAHVDAGHGAPADASGEHAAPMGETANGQEPKDPPLQPLKRGKSVKQTEEPKGGGGHGGGHGEEPAAHGEEAKGGHGEAAKPEHGADPHAAPSHGESQHGSLPEKDFAQLTTNAHDPDVRYKPGAYFRFEGMPAGVTPDQLNDAWKRVQEGVGELERRAKALDLREQELREFSDDIARRQTEVGKERAEVEAMQRQLDERIAQFQDQVKMIKTDEVALLQKNAKTYSNMPPAKVAELVRDYWKTESGQVQMLKTFEFLTADAYDQILAQLPNELVRELLERRGRIGRETMPSGAPRK